MSDMKIIINRFCLTYGGRLYKQGDVVDIADEQAAHRLIARSNGDIAPCNGENAAANANYPTEEENAPNGATTGNGTNNEQGDNVETGGAELPAFDPTAAVQKAKRR